MLALAALAKFRFKVCDPFVDSAGTHLPGEQVKSHEPIQDVDSTSDAMEKHAGKISPDWDRLTYCHEKEKVSQASPMTASAKFTFLIFN